MSRQALFTLDLNRCTGCAACTIACRVENDAARGMNWRRVYTFNEARLPSLAVLHYSLACNHCVEPACMYGCPADAYTKEPRTGAVLLDSDRCLGCRYCAWLCPYEAPQFDAAAGVMRKCTFCFHRLEQGGQPACVTACPVEALGFEADGEPPTDSSHPGMPDSGLRPAIRILGKRSGTTSARTTAPGTAMPIQRRRDAGSNPSLGSEWPLWVFSFVATLMVASLTASQAAGRPPRLPALLLAGGAALGVSALHLGRPLRAWRAVANLRTSWVSREIAGFSAFLLAVGTLVIGDPGPLRGWLAVGLGFATLVAVDLVYRVRGQAVRAVPHSAMTTVTAVLFIGLLLREPLLVVPTAGLKIYLYGLRLLCGRSVAWPVAVVRLGAGFVAPAVAWLALPRASDLALIAGPLLGELIDRAQFYAELDFPNPPRQIDSDLRRLASAAAPERRQSATV